mgnify:CR=1 FL=1
MSNTVSQKVDFTTNIPSGTDFNNVKKSGFYRITDVSTKFKNCPAACNYGQLLVIRGQDTIAQLAFDYTNSTMFYLRTGVVDNPNGDSWRSWSTFKSS